MTAGFHESGAFSTVRAVEMDPVAAASFAATFGDASSMSRRIGDWLEDDDVPSVDVVVGGPPCQGFSTLGSQDAEDVRNALWHDYALTIVRAEPRYFVLENVGAFLTSRQFADLRAATEPGGLLADYDVRGWRPERGRLRRRPGAPAHHPDRPPPRPARPRDCLRRPTSGGTSPLSARSR